jgi:hypothetical protein
MGVSASGITSCDLVGESRLSRKLTKGFVMFGHIKNIDRNAAPRRTVMSVGLQILRARRLASQARYLHVPV